MSEPSLRLAGSGYDPRKKNRVGSYFKEKPDPYPPKHRDPDPDYKVLIFLSQYLMIKAVEKVQIFGKSFFIINDPVKSSMFINFKEIKNRIRIRTCELFTEKALNENIRIS